MAYRTQLNPNEAWFDKISHPPHQNKKRKYKLFQTRWDAPLSSIPSEPQTPAWVKPEPNQRKGSCLQKTRWNCPRQFFDPANYNLWVLNIAHACCIFTSLYQTRRRRSIWGWPTSPLSSTCLGCSCLPTPVGNSGWHETAAGEGGDSLRRGEEGREWRGALSSRWRNYNISTLLQHMFSMLQ